MPQTHSHFHHFNKNDFVKSYIATISDKSRLEEEGKKAVIIADLIEERQDILLSHLATKKDLELTKQDLKRGIKDLKNRLTIRITIIMATLLTLLPLITEFLKKTL